MSDGKSIKDKFAALTKPLTSMMGGAKVGVASAAAKEAEAAAGGGGGGGGGRTDSSLKSQFAALTKPVSRTESFVRLCFLRFVCAFGSDNRLVR